MDNEKDLLKKDLNNLEKPDEIEKFAKDAELMGHPDIASLAREKITSLQSKVKQTEITPKQISSVESLGGDAGTLAEKTKEVDQKIEEVKKETTEQIEETSNLGESGNNENVSFLTEKGKQEKFDLFKSEFEKFYKEGSKQEYSLDELKSNIEAANSNPKAINGLLESLPKDVVNQLKADNYSISAGAITSWQNSVGGQISKLSNERVNVYNKSGEVIGIAAKNSEEYLATVANAARFVPKDISQKFVVDAINNFTNEEVRNSTGARFLIGNEESKNQRNNIIRNLVESGYSPEVKNFLSSELKNKQMTPSEIFAYSKNGLLSENEVKDVLDKAGYLEDSKQEIGNSKWE